jgi:hypothetical protein
MLSPFITILLAVFYPWLWFSLKIDWISFRLIKCIFKGFGDTEDEHQSQEGGSCCCFPKKNNNCQNNNSENLD